MRQDLNKRIDDAVRQIPERERLAREIANTRGRMAELQCNAPAAQSSSTCSVNIEGNWTWAWGHGDQELGRQGTTISAGPVQFSRAPRQGQPADGTMPQSGNSGVWKCNGSSVTFEWQQSVDTLSIGDASHMNGQGRPDNDAKQDWVHVSR